MDFLTELESCVPSLRRYARALLRDPDGADDLVQDCLERALSRRHLWRGGQGLRPWLFRILHNIYANEIRSRRARPVFQPIDSATDLPAGGGSHDARIELREMERALNLLPEEQRYAVLLVALTGLSYQECADALGIPIGTVMSRLSRGREHLRRCLAGEAGPSLRRVK
jgi:RNA polymerase sigma-70 factor (ECF subfamily)